MPNGGRQFKRGESGNPGGRPKKPEWVKGKGEEALKVIYAIMTDEETKVTDRITAARLIAEYDLGKPQQRVEQTNVNLDATPTQSLSESLRIIRELTGDE